MPRHLLSLQDLMLTNICLKGFFAMKKFLLLIMALLLVVTPCYAVEITGTVTEVTDTSDYGEYDYIDAYVEGFARVEKDGKHGFINEAKELVVPCIYDDALYYSQGMSKVCKDGKWGFVDTTGKVAIPLSYDWAVSFDDSGYAAVQKNGKWGYIDKKNNVVIDFIYDEAGNFEKGLAVVSQEGKWGSINTDNNVVITFSSASKEEAYEERSKVLYPAQYADFDDGSNLPQNTTAMATAATVVVNGKKVEFEAYEIAGYNFFKLRDLAYTLSGSEKQFNVVWNDSIKRIELTSYTPYTVAGGEMSAPSKTAADAVMNKSALQMDGYDINLVAYNINDYNYFKLRDIAKAFNIGVTWDDATQTIGIDTLEDYAD